MVQSASCVFYASSLSTTTKIEQRIWKIRTLSLESKLASIGSNLADVLQQIMVRLPKIVELGEMWPVQIITEALSGEEHTGKESISR